MVLGVGQRSCGQYLAAVGKAPIGAALLVPRGHLQANEGLAGRDADQAGCCGMKANKRIEFARVARPTRKGCAFARGSFAALAFKE
jgi:hypothetical protein